MLVDQIDPSPTQGTPPVNRPRLSPVFAPATTTAATEDLPAWDLSDLYSAPDSAAVKADFLKAEVRLQGV